MLIPCNRRRLIQPRAQLAPPTINAPRRFTPTACASATARRWRSTPWTSPSERARCTGTWARTGPARRQRSGAARHCTGPRAGRGELFGVDAWADPVAAHRRVAYVAGEPFLWPSLTARRRSSSSPGCTAAPTRLPGRSWSSASSWTPRKKVRALSKGNRQKVQLIAALATRADLLLLDEPTSGLDPLMEMAFRDCVKEAKDRGQAVFLSSHILSEVEALCDRVGILREGRLVDQGTLQELRHLARTDGRGHVRGPSARAPAAARGPRTRSRSQRAAVRGLRQRRPADRRARRGGWEFDQDPEQPRAVTRGDLPAPLRRLPRPC